MPAFSLCSHSPQTVVTTPSCSLLPIYQPRKDKRLSWLTYSRRFTHISSHPSAVDRAQDSESSPVKDQRSTAAPSNQLFSTVRTDLGYFRISQAITADRLKMQTVTQKWSAKSQRHYPETLMQRMTYSYTHTLYRHNHTRNASMT